MGGATECMMVKQELIILTVFYLYRIHKFLIKSVIFTSFEFISILKPLPDYTFGAV